MFQIDLNSDLSVEPGNFMNVPEYVWHITCLNKLEF